MGDVSGNNPEWHRPNDDSELIELLRIAVSNCRQVGLRATAANIEYAIERLTKLSNEGV